MSEWEVVGIREDLGSPDGPRWLVSYIVPLEFAPDGNYSYSFPKDVINSYVAAFGFDMEDEDDIRVLLDYIIHMAYINATLRSEGRGDEVVSNPFKMNPESIRERLNSQVREFKSERPLKIRKSPVKNMASRATEIDELSVHDTIRDDMKDRVDHEKISAFKDSISGTRDIKRV